MSESTALTQKEQENRTTVIVLVAMVQIFITVALVNTVDVKRRWPRVRQDGCLYALALTGVFLVSLMWPVAAALIVLWLAVSIVLVPFYLVGHFCCAPGQTCCGVDWVKLCRWVLNLRPALRERTPNTPGRQLDGDVEQQPPGSTDTMELPQRPPPAAKTSDGTRTDDMELPPYSLQDPSRRE
ncbi:hypothetical protein B0T26DRAFT_798385 [Lasiosphaeria miniovina]|uniref:Uncharacterized protein n=1 Tax=Lasiosphaeria miniovina TaxID=1954250 RepID=A0AA40BI32_9PEZI|nr:uncharacterized protein B0T26DRAFT_798385 [Lasiosphaeria miniovina]KAK0734564.1 hypothetical protein B0T26DRAFT_798385 [Lasiosphaeria miniovina]